MIVFGSRITAVEKEQPHISDFAEQAACVQMAVLQGNELGHVARAVSLVHCTPS